MRPDLTIKYAVDNLAEKASSVWRINKTDDLF